MKRNALMIFVLVVLFCMSCNAISPRSSQGGRAASFSLETVAGDTVSLDNYDGQNVILFFWTTWCPHCRGQLVEFVKQYSQIKASNIALISINIGETKDRVERFLENYSLEYPVLLDYNKAVARAYGVRGIPTIIFVSKDRTIIESVHALPSDYERYFR